MWFEQRERSERRKEYTKENIKAGDNEKGQCGRKKP